LELTPGTLGGRFTTVEGIISQVFDELEGRSNFLSGDGASKDSKENFKGFLGKLQQVLNGELFPVTLILNDPLSNSHLQNIYAPDSDPNMTIEQYERTYEDNENWGLNDIQTENYQQ
jgi:zinc finger protein